MGRRTGKEFELETLEERILLSGDPLLDPISALTPAQAAPENDLQNFTIATESETLNERDGRVQTESDSLDYSPGALIGGLFDGLDEGTDGGVEVAATASGHDDSAPENDLRESVTTAVEPITRPLAETASAKESTVEETDRPHKAVEDYDSWSAPPAEENDNNQMVSNSAPTQVDPEVDQDDAVWVLDADLHLDDSTSLEGIETLVIPEGRRLSGSGDFDVALVNGGTLSPGNSPGIETVASFTNLAGAVLEIEIEGNTPGVGGYDQINTTDTTPGSISLDGTIRIIVDPAFTPTVNETYNILTFASLGSITGVFVDGEGLYGFGDGSLYFDLEMYLDNPADPNSSGGLRLIAKYVNGEDFTSSIDPQELGDEFGKFLSDYFTLTGSIELSGFSIDIGGFVGFESGDFGVEKVAGGEIRIVSNTAAAFLDVGSFSVGITDADIIIVLREDGGMAFGTAGGTFTMTGGQFASATADSVDIQLNNTGINYAASNLTVTVGSISATLDIADETQLVKVTNLEFEMVDYGLTVGGTFAFQRFGTNEIHAVATGASATLVSGDFLVGVSAASLALVVHSNLKTALRASGTFVFEGGDFANATAGAVHVVYNDSGIDYSGVSLDVGGSIALLDAEVDALRLAVTDLAAEITGFAHFGGDFGFTPNGDDIDVVAENAYARVEAGDFKAGVGDGSLALRLKADTTFAISVSGSVQLEGGDFANATATLATVKFNNTGINFDETLSIEGVDADLLVVTGASSVSVVGLDAEMSGFVTFGGDFGFRLNPSGDVDVVADNAYARVVSGVYVAGVM